MTSDLLYNLIFKTSGDKNVMAVVEKMQHTVEETQKSIGGIGNKLKALNSIKLSAVLDQVDRVANGLNSLAQPGYNVSNSMHDLQAMTGVAGEKLQQIEKYARSSAKTFGGDAASAVETYKLLLGQLTPELANTPAALDAMGKSVQTTSKLMGGDARGATELLTTAMNQYGVSTADPIQASGVMANMMNVMAAAAGEGSAELPQIKQALEQAGMAAKGANVSFEETNAAIQVLDKAGKKGAEGGVALRNALAIIGQGRFLPKETQKELAAAGVSIDTLGNQSIPLAERLKVLQPVMNDGALLTKLFGMENQNAARALIGGIPEIERLTTAITGTNKAYEQAAVVMEAPAEKNKRLQAQIEDFQISIFNGTNGLLGYADVISNTTFMFTNMWPAVTALGNAVSFLTSKQKLQAAWTAIVSGATTIWAGAQAVLNAAFWANPITWIVALIIGLVAAIGYVVYAYDGWGKAWGHLMDFMKWSWGAFKTSFEVIWLGVKDAFLTGIEQLTAAWYKLQSLWDEDSANLGLSKIESKQNERARELADANGKLAEYVKNASEAGSKIIGADGLHSNKKTIGDVFKSAGKGVGISGPGMPGAAINTGLEKPGGSNAAMGKKGAEAIATGGTKSTTINVTVGSQQVTINASGTDEGVRKLGDTIIQELTRAVAMGAALGGSQ